MKKILFTLLVIILFSQAKAQSNAIDSLLYLYKTTKNSEIKQYVTLNLSKELYRRNKDSANIFLELAGKNYHNFKPNKKITSYYFYLKAYFLSKIYDHDAAIKYCDSCIINSIGKDLESQLADCYFSKAVSLYNIGNVSQSITYFKKAIPIFYKTGSRKNAVNGCSNLIAIYQDMNLNDSCEKYFNKAISIADTVEDCKVLARLYSNMSALFDKNHKFQTSLTYLMTALKYADRCDANKINILSNIGQGYMNINNYDKAEYYLRESYYLAYKLNQPDYILESTAAYALFYQNLGDFREALTILDTAIKYIDTTNYKQSSAIFCRTLAWSYTELNELNKANYYADLNIKLRTQSEDYNGLAEAYQYKAYIFYKEKKYYEAINMYLKGLDLAKEIGNSIFIKNYYQSLYKTYYETKNYERASYYSNLYIEMNDSITSYINSTINSELEAKYNSDKKENEIKLLNETAKFNQLELDKNKQQRIFLGIALALSLFIIIFVVFSYIQKRKSAILITKQNEELQIQKDIVESQKLIVEEHQKEILDSIHYAKRIQNSLLASDELLKSNLPDYFVFFQPKDIVSGDFYWASSLKNNQFALVTADSTGHGVPGAIMSILNIACLNEAIKEGYTLPNEILNRTRKEIISVLKRDGSADGGKDGMDCSLISFDLQNNEISYSAANNPIWIIRNNEIIECIPDKMPVGKHDKDNVSFKLHTIRVEKNDVIYTLTDGFPDQFGGPKGKKFKYKPLQQLLLSVVNEPMETQKQMLSDALNSWKGDLEQVDDVTIIGVRV